MKLGRETQEQCALMDWIVLQPEIAELAFHCPNEGRRSIIEGKILKRMGMRAGFPDLFISLARGPYHGLFLELKIHPNRPTASQAKVMEILTKQGYLTAVCYGADEAILFLERYLALGSEKLLQNHPEAS